MHTLETKYPKQLAEFLAQTQKTSAHKITKAFVKENMQLVLAMDSPLAKLVLKEAQAIDPDIKGLKHYIKKDIAANLMDIQKLKKMNAQATQIAKTLNKLPNAKTDGVLSKGLRTFNAISMGIDVFEGTFNTTTALKDGNNATAVKEAANLGATLGSGWVAGQAVAMVFGVGSGPVGWVLIAAGSAVAAYYGGEYAKEYADEKADEFIKSKGITDKNPKEMVK